MLVPNTSSEQFKKKKKCFLELEIIGEDKESIAQLFSEIGSAFCSQPCRNEGGFVLQSVPVTALGAHRANGEHV